MKRRLIIFALAFALCLSLLAACTDTSVPESLEITSQPIKLSYILGEELNLEGGKFKIRYSNGKLGEEIAMTASGVSHNFDKNVLGEQEVEITYEKVKGKIIVTVIEDPEVVRIRTLTEQLLDGVENLTPSTVSGSATKVLASYTLLESLKDDEAFDDILASVNSRMPTYISILLEYYHLNTDQAKTTFLLPLLPKTTADLFDSIEEGVDDLADLTSEQFLIAYSEIVKLLRQANATGFTFIQDMATQLAGTATQAYEDDYYFEELDDDAFFDLYIAYLKVFVSDSGAEFLESAAFKAKMDTLFQLYYDAGFTRQITLKAVAEHFVTYYDTYYNTYIDTFSPSMTYDVYNAIALLEVAYGENADFYDSISAFDAIRSLESWYYFCKNSNEPMHPYIKLELDSLQNTYVYRAVEVYKWAEKAFDEYSRWVDWGWRDAYYEYGIYAPVDVNMAYVATLYLEELFQNEFEQDLEALAYYQEHVDGYVQSTLQAAEECYEIYSSLMDSELIARSVLLYEKVLVETNGIYYYGDAAFRHYFATILDEVRFVIDEFWEYMFLNDSDGNVIGQKLSSTTRVKEIMDWYAEYYVLYTSEEAVQAYRGLVTSIFTNYDGTDTYTIYYLRDAYMALHAFEELTVSKQNDLNLGLSNGGLSKFLADAFEDNNTYDLFVFDAGVELLTLSYTLMFTANDDQAYFILEYDRVAGLINAYDEQTIDLINTIWLNDSYEPLFINYTDYYNEILYPYIGGNDKGITEAEIEQFMTAFYALADIKKEYSTQITTITDRLATGTNPSMPMVRETSIAAEEFMGILHALPFAMQEKLASMAVSTISLVGNANKNLSYIYAYDKLSSYAAAYQFAKLIISLDDNYYAFMAENERLGQSGELMENAYYYRLFEVYRINDINNIYETYVTGVGKTAFDSSLIGAMYQRQKLAVDTISPAPSVRFDEMVELFRRVSLAYEQTSKANDMTYFMSMKGELDDFLSVMLDENDPNYSTNDALMYQNSIIMMEIMDGVGYYQQYISATKMWVIAGTPIELYNDLFNNIFLAEMQEIASNYYGMTTENSGALIDEYLAISRLYLTDAEAFLSLGEGVITSLLSSLEAIDPQYGEGFVNLYGMFADIICDYYAETLSQKEVYALSNLLSAKSAKIIYNKEVAKYEQMLIEEPDYAEYQLYNVETAMQQFLVRTFISYNLYGMLETEPAQGTILYTLCDDAMTLALNLVSDPAGETFSAELHNIGVLLINARMASSQGNGYDFMVVLNLAENAIAGLSGADLADFNTKIYIEADENDGEPAFTLKDMYDLVKGIYDSDQLFEYQIQGAKDLFLEFEPIAWQFWLGSFSTVDVSDDIQGFVDELAVFMGLCSEPWEFNNFAQSYLGNTAFLDIMYEHALNTFDVEDAAFGTVVYMLQSLSYLINYEYSIFLDAFDQATFIHSQITNYTAFNSTFNVLYEAMQALYQTVLANQ